MADETMTPPSAADLLDDLLGADDSPPPPLDAKGYSLRLSGDRVTVLVDCPDPLAALAHWSQRICEDLEKLEIPNVPSPEIVADLLRDRARRGKNLASVGLITGRPAKHSIDTKLVWAREFFGEGWQMDELTGRINYREKVENCAVHRNELLLRAHEAREGEPGMDLFGEKIPVEAPEKIRIRCGKGVTEVEEKGALAYFADLDGRVRFTDGTLSVDEVYQVAGHVGLASGNIHHPGSVTVTGDVLAGSVIDAEGDVVIGGVIEEALITCGGNLTVGGGILGGKHQIIRAGGNIEAKFINESDVAAGGDIVVAKQISHSRVRSLGSVRVPKGRIAGGTTIALLGIRLGTAGSPGNAATHLTAGIDYTLQAQIDLYEDKIKRLEMSLVPIENALRNAGSEERDLSEGIQQVVECMALKRLRLKEAIALQKTRMKKLQDASGRKAIYHVVIFDEVWSGTTICLGQACTQVKKSIPKPRVVLLREERARVLPLTDENLPPEPPSA
jgi:hypothetical protein